MENAIQDLPISVAPNDAITFSTDAIRTSSATCCGWLEHEQGSSQFTITKCGLYLITFNTNITSATAGATPLVIRANGEAITGTQMDHTVGTANVYDNVASARIIKVCGNSSKTITIANIGANAVLIKNASLIIRKLA